MLTEGATTQEIKDFPVNTLTIDPRLGDLIKT